MMKATIIAAIFGLTVAQSASARTIIITCDGGNPPLLQICSKSSDVYGTCPAVNTSCVAAINLFTTTDNARLALGGGNYPFLYTLWGP